MEPPQVHNKVSCGFVSAARYAVEKVLRVWCMRAPTRELTQFGAVFSVGVWGKRGRTPVCARALRVHEDRNYPCLYVVTCLLWY